MLNINPFSKFNTQFNRYYQRNNTNCKKAAQNSISTPPCFAPLSRDTISFTALERLNRSLLEAFDNKEVCEAVYENADVAAENLRKTLQKSLSDFIATDKNPDGLIQRITTRIKTPDSIREKAAGKLGSAITSDLKRVFDPNKADEIKRVCGDIVGARVILRRSEVPETSKIIDAFIEDVKAGRLKITRIENYQPQNIPQKWEYFRKEDLKRLADAVNSMLLPGEKPVEVVQQSKKTGYIALHLDVDLSDPEFKVKNNGYRGEIQIVGCDVANLKEVEDFCYKLKYDKDIKSGSTAYKAFSEYFLKLLHLEGYKGSIEDNFVEYTSRAYLHQRKKEPVSASHRKRKDNSLPTLEECGMTGKLPAGLDFNNLAAIKFHCDKIYELTSGV